MTEQQEKSYLNNLFSRRLLAKLTREQVLYVWEILDETCHNCWDADSGCQCWNDE